MTYVILYDGFDIEGWESIQMLFAPSFEKDGVKIYPHADTTRAVEINDIMDRSVQHTFIFLTVQKVRRKGKEDSLVEKYRYKSLLEKIHKEFSYCESHQNILCVVDRIPKDIGSGLYIDQEKEIALALDKYGFLNLGDTHPYYFSIEDIHNIRKEIFQLIHAEEEVKKEKFSAQINTIIEKTIEEKRKKLRGENDEVCVRRLESVGEQFLDAFWKLDLSSTERREYLIENTLRRVLGETVGIADSLNSISILTYRPDNIYEEDNKTHMIIASLISLIANRTTNILKKGWFEVSKLEIDKAYLKRSLEHLASIRLSELHDEVTTVNIHNIAQLTYSLESLDKNTTFAPIGEVPWHYSKTKERYIKQEIENTWEKMALILDKIDTHLLALRNDIYAHPGSTTDMEYSYNELLHEAHKPVKTKRLKTSYSKDDFVEMMSQISKEATKSKFESYFDKLPSLGSCCLALLTFSFIVGLTAIFPIKIWSVETSFSVGGILLGVLIFISIVTIWYYRREVNRFLAGYLSSIRSIQEKAYDWYDKTIRNYKYTYETKLKYENRIFFRKKLKKLEETKRKWKLHNNHVAELNKISYDIATNMDLDLEIEESYLPLSTIELDPDLVNEYALFTEKKQVDELITDRTMSNKELQCFGLIKMLEIQRIENGV